MINRLKYSWIRFWMLFAGRGLLGRMATRLATLLAGPYYQRVQLSSMSPRGYISPKATIHHPDFQLGSHVLVSDGVLIYQDHNGGPVKIGASVHLHHAIYIQTGQGGTVTIGAESHIQPRCQLSAYKAPITIGRRCEIAPNCAFYSYNHGVDPHEIVRKLPLQSKGGIVIGDDVWLGYGVIVLDGVRIGKGAVIGAGAVVTRNIPEGAIAVGNPARVLKYRRAVSRTETNGSTKAF